MEDSLKFEITYFRVVGGETVTASKKYLKPLTIVNMTIEPKKLANQLTERRLKIMGELMIDNKTSIKLSKKNQKKLLKKWKIIKKL